MAAESKAKKNKNPVEVENKRSSAKKDKAQAVKAAKDKNISSKEERKSKPASSVKELKGEKGKEEKKSIENKTIKTKSAEPKKTSVLPKKSDAFTWLIKPEFKNIDCFGQYNLAVAQNHYGRYGYIDKSGIWKIDPVFYWVINFYDGLAMVSTSTIRYDDTFNAKYINKDGKFISDKKLDYGRPFFNGLASAREDISGKFGYLNKKGEWEIEPQFDSGFEFNDNDLAIVGKSGEYYLINRRGKKEY